MDRKTRIVLSSLVVFAAFVLLALATYTSPRPGKIAPTGMPVDARFSHTATLLPNGKVLVAGGMERNGVWLDSAELWDPETETFAATARMSFRRAGATATLLPSGRVLIAGGSSGGDTNLATAELYDPATNRFTRTGDMIFPRAHATAVLLRSGKVLVAGGSAGGDNDQLNSAELYDPATERFTLTGAMRAARSCYTAVPLLDGRVLLVGGLSGGQYPNHRVESTAEIYDPVHGTFRFTGSLSTPRYKHGAALLPDGHVLIVGGSNEDGRQYEYASSEIFDPQSGRFTSGPTMKYERYKLPSAVVVLNDGRILVAGGASHAEIFDPDRNDFVTLNSPRLDGYLFSTATLLRDGRVLLVDGYGARPRAGAIKQAQVFEP